MKTKLPKRFKKNLLNIGMLILGLAVFIPTNTKATEITDFRIRFCNNQTLTGGSKELSLHTKPNELNKVCLYLLNSSPEATYVNLNFIDGTLTNDAEKNKACKNENENSVFGQYVKILSGDGQVKDINLSTGTNNEENKDYRKNNIFLLPGQSVEQHIAEFKLPEGYAGKIYGCATLTLVETGAQEEGMFKVINRLGAPIEIIVDGKIITGLELLDPTKILDQDKLKQVSLFNHSFFISHENGIFILNFSLKNTGNILQEGNYGLKFQAIPFGKAQIYTGNFAIPPQEIRHFSIPLATKWYDALGNFDLSITHGATFDFESDAITADMKEQKQIEHQYSFQIFDWIKIIISITIIIGLIILFFILGIISKRKGGNGTTQKNNQKKINHNSTRKKRPYHQTMKKK